MSQTTSTTLKSTASQAESFIDKQLNKTGAHVVAMDVLAGVMILACGVLLWLLIVALIDAWVIELNVAARTVTLGLLLVGVAGFSYKYFWPLVYRRLNPAYAAKMIEEGRGGLRNSLINYLSIKESAAQGASRAVVLEMESQAAKHLREIPVESTIDRSNIIRLGVFLTVIVSLFGAYKLLSPKDPFQTVARILAPTSKISRPARVIIVEVDPGDTEVLFGESLLVNTLIEGTLTQPPELVFSTRDGQILNRSLEMTPTENRNRYQVELSTGVNGIQQDLRYFVRAGDGRSSTYDIRVKSAATITVSQMTLSPPGYTEFPQSTLFGQGEVEAYEGTKVTIVADANVPLQSANIELLNDRPLDNNGNIRVVERIIMQTNDRSATGSFILQFGDGGGQRMSHYRLTFRDEQGRLTEGRTRYPIRIIPDLPPQIAITQPVDDIVRLPVNSQLRVAIRAIDQDFRISRIQFRLDQRGQAKVNQALDLQQQPDGQVSASFTIVPRLLGLQVGDQAVFYATAFDNRVSALTGVLDPNQDVSRIITVEIVDAQGESQDDKVEEQQQSASQEQSDESQPQSGNEGDGDSDSQQDADSDEGNKDQQGKGDAGQDSQASQDYAGQEGDPSSKQDQKSDGKESESQQASKSGEDPAQSDSNSQKKEQPSERTAADGESTDEQTAADQGGSRPSDQGAQRSDTKSGGTSQDSSGNGADSARATGNQGGSDQAQPRQQNDIPDGDVSADDGRGENVQPLDRDAHAGERFERLLEKLQDMQQQESKNDGSSSDRTEATDSQETISRDSKDDDTNRRQTTDDESSDSPRNDGDQQPSDRQPNGSEMTNQTANDQRDGTRDRDSENEQGDQTNDNLARSETQRNDQTSETTEGAHGGNDSDGEANAKRSQDQDMKHATDGKQDSQARETGEDSRGDDSKNAQSGTDQAEDQGAGRSSLNDDTNQAATDQQSDGQKHREQGAPNDAGATDQPRDDGSQQTRPQDHQSNGADQSSEPNSQTGEGGDSPNQPLDRQSGDQNSQRESNDLPQSDQAGEGNMKDQSNMDRRTRSQDDRSTTPDKANLEYANKATDLVLEYLEKQQHNPDPKLLEEMNWTEDEMREFLRKWRELKEKARKGAADDRQRLEDALESLGLRPAEIVRNQFHQRTDDQRGFEEDAAINRPPTELIPAFKAFQNGRSRVKQ
ncbi:MAG TPA: hypothetical protein PKD64_02480 [Pirellulaceae bacterium]|nr:hypothetical protein [Pirellulaceae bacterium]HMO91035.1 hypothetical protein [Pirellulaceae bacterium]HMP68150.1 hypothetical protein [Pirellulaceae bacterium]